jgi:leucyl aminopeptidase
MNLKIMSSALAAVLLLTAGAVSALDDASFGAASVPSPAGADVWVSFDRADLGRPEAAKFPLSSPILSTSKTELFRVPPSMLPLLSEFMHDKFNRCGGFFAYRTKAKAQAALAAKPAAAMSGPFTLDQQAVVTPLLKGVKASNLQGTIEALAAFNNRYYTSDSGVEAAHWLQGRWQELSAKIPGASVELVSHDGWKQPSVVLTIPGTGKADELVVLGGHLDSINGWGGEDARAPGADDNASGIAVLTETVRLLAESGFRPARTIQFMGYAAEEVGLRGSQDIAERYASSGKKVVAVIQYDMTNFRGSDEEIFLLSDFTDPALNDFLGKLVDTYLGVKRGVTECGYACSDHASWNKQGFPAAIAFEASFENDNKNIHTDHDTLATSGGDASHSVVFAQLAAAFAVETAKPAKN